MTYRIAIVASRFNEVVTDQLVVGALEGLAGRGVQADSVRVLYVPGALELPLAAQRLAESGEYDAIVCLGAVIRGDTDHHIHVGGQCAAGLQRVQLDTGVPTMMGVLTTDTLEQAMARAGGPLGNRGSDTAEAAIEMVDLLRDLAKSSPC